MYFSYAQKMLNCERRLDEATPAYLDHMDF